MDDEEDVCGEAYDHDIPDWDCEDGMCIAVCRECGAELMWDEHDTD